MVTEAGNLYLWLLKQAFCMYGYLSRHFVCMVTEAGNLYVWLLKQAIFMYGY